MAASPCSCGCQTPISQITAGKPNLHYPIEYRPPEPPPLLSLGNSPDITLTSYLSPSHSHLIYSPPQSSNIHTAEFCAPYMYTPSFKLTCHTTLSSGQPYYALELANPITTPTLSQIPERKYVSCDEKVNGDACESVSFKGCGDACVGDRDKLQMESQLKPGVAVVGTVGRNDQADTSKLVKEAVEIQGELIVDAIEVEPQVFDKSPVRISDLVVETVCEDDWNNDDDSFIRMNLTIFQHSSPIMEYVTEYMRIKSRAEFKFKCDFEDPLLAYCFVEGLDEDTREALELWAPQTLQEAIYLATFQELWIDESSLVESIVRKSDERLVKDGLLVDNYGVEIDSDVLAIVSVGSYFTVTRMIPATTIATILDDNCLNVDKKNFRNFDPGGGTTDAITTVSISRLGSSSAFVGTKLVQDAWYFTAITIIFDPGGYGCYQVLVQHAILEDKNSLRGMVCNK